MTSDDDSDDLQRLGMLASALAGRTLAVGPVAAGEPAWTDGTTVFLDANATAKHQLESLAVQASLLAGGGLEPDVVRKLTRRPALARRYLAVEGHRALSANEDLLPLPARSLIDLDVAAGVDSPAASLMVAERRGAIDDPPASFGVIRARRLLAAEQHAAQNPAMAGAHVPRREGAKDLADLDDEGEDAADVMDPFSSPVGGGGVAGKLFQRFTTMVRRLSGGGPPGADSATHRSRTGTRGAGAVTSTAAGASVEADSDDGEKGSGTTYPEWDTHRRRYRPDWCTVHELDPPREAGNPPVLPDIHALRRPLARLGVGLERCHRQTQGDDVDIDAAVEARVELLAGSAPDDAVYLDSLRRRRDLAVLLLLDISGSAAEEGTTGETVHHHQRSAAAALTVALHELGDRIALYAFHSQGRSAVHVVPVKRFDDHLDARVLQRIGALKPGAYSRLGAAIRHGASVISEKAGTSRCLLVVISDGLAYDHGYERVYGAADARRALAEARHRGIGCLCLTIGASTDNDELRRVFGSAAHASIPKPEQLSRVIGPLFRSALSSADLRRRVP